MWSKHPVTLLMVVILSGMIVGWRVLENLQVQYMIALITIGLPLLLYLLIFSIDSIICRDEGVKEGRLTILLYFRTVKVANQF